MKPGLFLVPVFHWAIILPALCSAASYTVTDLGTLGRNNSFAYGINASGQVTGSAETSQVDQSGNHIQHAFLYDGTMHDLGTLGGGLSLGYGINSSGQVTGVSNLSRGGQHAFLYDGTMHDLGTLGGSFSQGFGINSSGQIVGSSLTSSSSSDAFLYDRIHGMVDLNSLINPSSGWVLASGAAINDAGQITGSGFIGGQDHAFLLTPIVSEPSSLILAALGVIGLAAWGWRRVRLQPCGLHGIRRSA